MSARAIGCVRNQQAARVVADPHRTRRHAARRRDAGLALQPGGPCRRARGARRRPRCCCRPTSGPSCSRRGPSTRRRHGARRVSFFSGADGRRRRAERRRQRRRRAAVARGSAQHRFGVRGPIAHARRKSPSARRRSHDSRRPQRRPKTCSSRAPAARAPSVPTARSIASPTKSCFRSTSGRRSSCGCSTGRAASKPSGESIAQRFDRVYDELGVIEASGNPAFRRHDDKPLLRPSPRSASR